MALDTFVINMSDLKRCYLNSDGKDMMFMVFLENVSTIFIYIAYGLCCMVCGVSVMSRIAFYNSYWHSYSSRWFTLIILSLSLLTHMSSGTRIKTRKRNIAAPLDPAAFADAVVQIYLDNAGDLVIVTYAM